MDPLTALGLVSNVVQLGEVAAKTFSKGHELLKTGTTADIEHVDFIAKDLFAVCAEINCLSKADGNAEVDEADDDGATQKQQSLTQAQVNLEHQEGERDAQALGGLAQKAAEAAQDLTSLLEHLRISDATEEDGEPRKKKRKKIEVAKRALKIIWNEKEIGQLQARIRDLQQSLVLRLVTLQKTSCPAVLAGFDPNPTDLSTHRLGRESRYESVIHADASLLEADGSASPLSTAVKETCARLATCTHTITSSQRVLASLSFGDLHSRELAVADSHTSTCDWIFADERLGFVHWASRQDGRSLHEPQMAKANDVVGIFWITGKPGSGKSTLMKHITRNSRTRALLAEWAAPARAVIAYHFFWHAGTGLQNGESGLLRSLAYYIVQQSPDAAMKFVPDRFTTMNRQCHTHKSPPCSGNLCEIHMLPSWTQEELRRLILGFAAECSADAKICFFIDGLDEYFGEPTELIELLATLSRSSSVKMCVSSRPWAAFTHAYDGRADSQLAVQDLNANDMAAYIRDKTASSALFQKLRTDDPEGYEELVGTIREKAQGVFLWVSLVLRSLLRGLTNDDDLDTLMGRLSEYPDELSGVYKRIFDRVEKVYRKVSGRILLGIGHTGSLPLRAPKCMELELAYPDYASSLPLRRKTKASADVLACSHKAVPRFQRKCLSCWSDHLLALQGVRNPKFKGELTRHLDARCADFLEIVNNEIVFIHRTASDYLKEEASAELIERAGVDFDVGMSLTRVYYTGFMADHAIHWLEKQQAIDQLVYPCNAAECHRMRQGWQGSLEGAMYTDGRPLRPKAA